MLNCGTQKKHCWLAKSYKQALIDMEPNREKLRQCLKMVQALLQAMDASRHVQRSENVLEYCGYRQFARKFQQIVTLVAGETNLPPVIEVWDAEKLPLRSKTRVTQQKEYFDGIYANLSILNAFLKTEINVVDDEILSLRDFFQSRLRSAIIKTPENEREIQDIIEHLLIGRGMQKGEDYDRETGRVRHSSKEVVPDFAIRNLSLAIEVKLVKTTSRLGRVVDEISADIVSYMKGYSRLLFLIYDLGHIRDEFEFRHDLERNSNVTVVIVKH